MATTNHSASPDETAGTGAPPGAGGTALSPPAADRSGLTTRLRLILAIVLLADVLDLMDSTITNIAAPTIVRDMGGGESLIKWLGAGYALAMGVLLVLGGRLGDRYAAHVPDRHRGVHPGLARLRPGRRPGDADRRAAGARRFRGPADPPGHRHRDQLVLPRAAAARDGRVRDAAGGLGSAGSHRLGLPHQLRHRRADLAADIPDQHRPGHRRGPRRAEAAAA